MHQTAPRPGSAYPLRLADGPMGWADALALCVATHLGYCRWKPGRGDARLGRCRRWRLDEHPKLPLTQAWPMVARESLLVEMQRRGESVEHICRFLPVSAWPIAARHALIRRMRADGMTSDAIGEEIGMTGRGVRYVLSRHGETPTTGDVVTRCHNAGAARGEEQEAG